MTQSRSMPRPVLPTTQQQPQLASAETSTTPIAINNNSIKGAVPSGANFVAASTGKLRPTASSQYFGSNGAGVGTVPESMSPMMSNASVRHPYSMPRALQHPNTRPSNNSYRYGVTPDSMTGAPMSMVPPYRSTPESFLPVMYMPPQHHQFMPSQHHQFIPPTGRYPLGMPHPSMGVRPPPIYSFHGRNGVLSSQQQHSFQGVPTTSTQSGGATFAASPSPNNATNMEFLSAIKKTREPAALDVSESTPTIINTTSKESVQSVATAATPSEPRVVTETANEFIKLMQSISKPLKEDKTVAEDRTISNEFQTKVAQTVPSKTVASTMSTTSIQRQPPVATTTSTMTTTPPPSDSAVAAASQVSFEFTAAIKSAAAASSESVSAALCPYGFVCEGRNTYTIADMLAIRDNLQYDKEKMINTLSKFRISKQYKPNIVNLAIKSQFKTMEEKIRLGLVDNLKTFQFKFNKICNMLSISNFHRMVKDMRELCEITTEMVSYISNSIYEKITKEMGWCHVFSQFVIELYQHFKTMGDESNGVSGLDEHLRTTLLALLDVGLTRDSSVEAEMKRLRCFKSSNPDEVDAVINQLGELEESYRNKLFGLLLFVSHLHYFSFVDNAYVERILASVFNQLDTIGVEMACCLLFNVGAKFVQQPQSKTTFIGYMDVMRERLNKTPNGLDYKARFSVMDLLATEQNGYKELPTPVLVPDENVTKDAAVNTTKLNFKVGLESQTSNLRSYNKTSSKDYFDTNSNSSAFGGNRNRTSVSHRTSGLTNNNTRFKRGGDTSDVRRPNLDVFANNRNNNVGGRGRSAIKTRGASFTTSNSSVMSRYRNLARNFDVNLDSEQSTTNVAGATEEMSSKSSFSMPRRAASMLERESTGMAQSALTELISATTTTTKTCTTTDVVAPTSAVSALKDDSPLARDDVSINLVESAQTMIGRLFTGNTNVSQLLIDLAGHSLSDHPKIFVAEAFDVYRNSSSGHYVFGVLLDALVTRQPEILPIITPHLSQFLDTLALDGLDEPILWDYFFMCVLPMALSGALGLDTFGEVVSGVPDVGQPEEVILNMLEFAQKRLAKYDYVKLVVNQLHTEYWKRVAVQYQHHTTVVAALSQVEKLLTGTNDQFIDWVDVFLNVSYDSEFAARSLATFYNETNDGLDDLAKSLFLNATEGDAFTNDLMSIFAHRSTEFMDSLFGQHSSRRLLKAIAHVLAEFSYSPIGVLVDIGVPMLKNKHVDKDWLNEWRKENESDISSGINSAIYRIAKASD